MNAAAAPRGLGLWSATALVITNVFLVLAVVTLVAINRPFQACAGLALMLLGLPVSRVLISPRSTPVLP